MLKCDSIKLQSSFIEITLWHGCSPVNLLHIFRTPFLGTPREGWFCTSADIVQTPLLVTFNKFNGLKPCFYGELWTRNFHLGKDFCREIACASFGQVTVQIVFELVFVDSLELFHINFLQYVFCLNFCVYYGDRVSKPILY